MAKMKRLLVKLSAAEVMVSVPNRSRYANKKLFHSVPPKMWNVLVTWGSSDRVVLMMDNCAKILIGKLMVGRW